MLGSSGAFNVAVRHCSGRRFRPYTIKGSFVTASEFAQRHGKLLAAIGRAAGSVYIITGKLAKLERMREDVELVKELAVSHSTLREELATLTGNPKDCPQRRAAGGRGGQNSHAEGSSSIRLACGLPTGKSRLLKYSPYPEDCFCSLELDLGSLRTSITNNYSTPLHPWGHTTSTSATRRKLL